MQLRDWLAIIVIVAIVLIVLDGFRRKWRERNPVRVKLDKNIPPAESDLEEELTRSELPSGGARTKRRDEIMSDDEFYGRQEMDNRDYDFEEKVPVLMDSVDIDAEAIELQDEENADIEHSDPAEEETHYTNSFTDSSVTADQGEPCVPEHGSAVEEADTSLEDDNETGIWDADTDSDSDEDEFTDDGNDDIYDENDVADHEDDIEPDEDPFHDPSGRIEPGFGDNNFSDDELADERFTDSSRDKKVAKAAKAEAAPLRAEPREWNRDFQAELPLGNESGEQEDDSEEGTVAESDAVEEVIVINVMAKKDEYFAGREMLPVLMQQGMRLGDMSIFHRHADASGNGPVIFSMANMVKPGTFDMAQMEQFTTPGVSLFLQLPCKRNNMQSFETMLATANALRDVLHGELKDENRSVLTRQTIEHCRQRIRDFELRKLSRK